MEYYTIFSELIRKPFQETDLIWGIVPLYFSWAFAELTGDKPNFKTAIQTGFNVLWAGAQWTWHPAQQIWQKVHYHGIEGQLNFGVSFTVNVIVTALTIALGALALYSGLRRRFPKYFSFLGHNRFSSYFTITMFPIQTNHIQWTWDHLIAIMIFAVPTWVGLSLLRRALSTFRSARGSRR